ncbi:hypothetical protein CORC01_14271, partial [Colletotrichum orchidophilum]
LFESELRNKCSYKVTLPYWDLSLYKTADGFSNSSIFDNINGFGGNGRHFEDISDDQEFLVKDPTEIPGRSGTGSSVEPQPQCLRRDFSPTIIDSALRDEVRDRAVSAPTCGELNSQIQGYSSELDGLTLRAGTHLGMGGAIGEGTCELDVDVSAHSVLLCLPSTSRKANIFLGPGMRTCTPPPAIHSPTYHVYGALDKVWNDWQRRGELFFFFSAHKLDFCFSAMCEQTRQDKWTSGVSFSPALTKYQW